MRTTVGLILLAWLGSVTAFQQGRVHVTSHRRLSSRSLSPATLGELTQAWPTELVAFTLKQGSLEGNDVFMEQYPKAIAFESALALAFFGLSAAGIGPLADAEPFKKSRDRFNK